MVTTTRSYGSAVTFLAKEESAYGANPGGNYEQLPYQTSDFGGAQGLIDSAILGLGREPRDPFKDILKVDGNIVVPVDVRDIGFWLNQVFGAESVSEQAATGTIVFADNPTALDTITINGVVFTFVAGGPTGNEILIAGTLALTLDNMLSDLNGSVDADVDDATYTEDGVDTLTITHDTTGPTGNSFTLAASTDTVSAATLLGGAYVHTFTSAKVDLPSFACEFGHSNVPAFLLSLGGRADSLQMNFQRTGGAFATIGLMAQSETRFATTQGGTPTTRTYETFNQFEGSIKKDSVDLANVVGASFTYSNAMESVETIRNDALIEGVDPTQNKITGTLESRYGDNVLVDVGINNTTFELELAYTTNAGKKLVFTFHKVFLERSKLPISGPGGVQQSFNYEAVYDSGNSASVTCALYNDIASY